MLHTHRRFARWIWAGLCFWVLASALAQDVVVDAGAARVRGEERVAARRARVTRFVGGRGVVGGGSGAKALAAARVVHQGMLAMPRASNLSASWTAVGPNQVTTAQFGNVTGRVTAVAIDPADATGNTVYVGTTGGGIWKSVNAAGAVGVVTFAPLTDTLPVFNAGGAATASLSIGAVAVGNGVVLAGTGDPNDATDSYYGAGILRSADGGVTWTLATGSQDGVAGNHSFFGLGVAGFAMSSVNTSLMVAAMSESAEGVLVNAPDETYSVKGLYWSGDAGVTWHMGTMMDGGQVVQRPLPGGAANGNAATAVVWNAVRQKFYAAVRFHGYYESVDGRTWTRLVHQPGAGLTTTSCPTNPGTVGNAACPIFRGALAVAAGTGDTFALTVDGANGNQGLYQDVCGLTAGACGGSTVLFGTALNAVPLEVGNGSHVILQGDYDLALGVAASGADTILYAGTVDLYRCSLAAGCSLRNTTNAQNGCASTAQVAGGQHAIAAVAASGGALVYLGNDGGLWRSTDGVNETGVACSLGDAGHFQNLNGGLGSLAEVASFAQAPADAGMLLAGLGALGTAGTGTAANSWGQLATGEGGTVAIDPANPLNWYLSTGAGVNIGRCSKGAGCTVADFAGTVIGAAQVANDVAAIHAPWLLDPGLSSDLIAGTCRVWRGPGVGGSLWSGSNVIGAPFGAPAASGCSATFPVVRSLGAGGPVSGAANAQSAGSEVMYAGLAGTLDGGQGLGGHVFATRAGHTATNTTAWTDVARSTVTNDAASAGVFNPGRFDVSSVAVDAHDATGQTVYVTVMGFAGSGTNAPHVYRSVDGGGHWTNISSNLPNAPANSVVVDPNDANTLYVALDTGVYVTTAVANCVSTNCWSVFGSGLPDAPAMQLVAGAGMPTGDGRTGELRVGTFGRGIWQIPLLTAANPVVPAMALNPTTVTYSAQQVGTLSAYVTVTVTNTGGAPLTVSSVTATGDYNEVDTCVGATVAQGATCAVQVRFAPTAAGTRTGVLTVYGNVAGGQATAALSGTATPPAAVVLTPLALNFPSTSVGATSAVQNITISNTGGTVVNVQSAVASGDFKISANTCTGTLAPQTGCTVSVVFAPATSGSRVGTLTVVDDAGMQVANLSGVGTNPATDALAPLTLSFAGTQLNTASGTQQVTLTNAGDVALTLIAAQVTSGDFTVVNGCGNSLNAHSSCVLSVAFAPKSVGQENGVLTVSDQFRAQTVQLIGLGLAPPGVSLSPVNGLAFGVVGVGRPSTVQTATLTNNGGVPLLLTSVTATGDFAAGVGLNTCGTSLAPGAVCTVGVIFSPAAAGSRAGTLTFVDNAANSPQTVALMGTGVDFALAASGPTTMTIASGQTATYALLLSSVAGVPGSVAFTCSGVPVHATCTVNPPSAALGGTTAVTVTVATGLATAWLREPEMPWDRRLVWFAALLPVGLLGRRRWMRRLGLMVALVALSGCAVGRTVPAGSGSGGGTTAVTPSGSYSLTVAGSSAGLVRTVGLTLVVQ